MGSIPISVERESGKQGSRISMRQYSFVVCLRCGETGAPHWEGDNPRPNTANRGVIHRICGFGWFHSSCNLKNGCGAHVVFCYKCGDGWQPAVESPKAWFDHGELKF